MTARPPTTRNTSTTPYTALPARWIDLLRDGDHAGDYSTPFAACKAFAVISIRHGHTVADYVAFMRDPRNQLGERYRRQDGQRVSEQTQTDRMRQDWAEASQHAASHPQVKSSPEAHARVNEIRDAVRCAGWPGRSGLRTKTVMLALLAVAESLGSVSPRVSARTLTEDTPFSLPTVLKGIRALSEAGWLTIDRRGMDQAEATIYRLDTPSRSLSPSHETGVSTPQPHLESLGDIRSDLGMALGVHAAAIYGALDMDVGQTARQVMARSGVTRPTVYRWLPRLALRGLARLTDTDGWYRGDTDPGLVESDKDVVEKVRRRETRHQLDRDGFHSWREARALDVDRADAQRRST